MGKAAFVLSCRIVICVLCCFLGEVWVWGDGVGVEGGEGGGGWCGWVGWSGQEKVKIRDSNPQALDPCSLAARCPNRSPQFSSVRFGSVHG